MRLQAVTVCINYADYLECIVPNRCYFDRWIIMTVPCDHETIALCERHGLEYRLSETLKPDGKNFHATLYKSSVLNEGLDALDPEGWALILDADVRLPRHFRERLNALSLQSGAVYGAAGRRICEDRELFEMLVECEPWDRFCARYSGVIGFFQLFDLAHPRNRYLPSHAPGTGPGDDDQFQLIFPPEMRRLLPMTVIHVGKSYVNWGGRTVGRFDTGMAEECRRQIRMTVIHTGSQAMKGAGRVAESYHADAAAVAAVLPEEIAGAGTVAVIGYFPGGRWREMTRRFGQVLLIDHFQVHHPSGSPLVEADRAVLRGLWAEEAAGCGNVELLGTHSATTLAGIAEGSLDALYLPGEVSPDWLAVAVPHWLGKLKDGALLCGDLYGLPHWPDATYAIALLLGTAVEVASSGFWWGRKRAGLVPPPRTGVAGEREVVLVNEGTEHLERLLVTMHQVRQSWAGRMRLFHWGPENQALRIAAVRSGVELIEVGEAPEEENRAVAETLAAGLGPQALYLPAGALVLGRVEELFSSAVEPGEFAAEQPWRMGGAAGAAGHGRPPAWHASGFAEEGAASPVVLLCTGPVEAWTDAAWAVWSGALTAMTLQLAAEIRVAADATLVILVGPEEIDEFEQVWLSLKFAPSVPVLVGLIGVAVEDVWLAPTGTEPQIVALSAVETARQHLVMLLAAVRTERVILLPPTARPLPGAELFPGEEADEEIALDPRSGWPGEAHGDQPVLGIFRTAALQRICAEGSVEPSGKRTDLARKGWLLKGARLSVAATKLRQAVASPL